MGIGIWGKCACHIGESEDQISVVDVIADTLRCNPVQIVITVEEKLRYGEIVVI